MSWMRLGDVSEVLEVSWASKKLLKPVKNQHFCVLKRKVKSVRLKRNVKSGTLKTTVKNVRLKKEVKSVRLK